MKYFLLMLLFFSSVNINAQAKPKQTHFTGIASYYHSKFEGRVMANGNKYVEANFTAACNILPLNKWVKVTNTRNGKSVIVKITDRMARNNKRLIDLSLASARRLSMTGHGLVKVKMELLPDYTPPATGTVQLQN